LDTLEDTSIAKKISARQSGYRALAFEIGNLGTVKGVGVGVGLPVVGALVAGVGAVGAPVTAPTDKAHDRRRAQRSILK
jgi:hypothetical protein